MSQAQRGGGAPQLTEELANKLLEVTTSLDGVDLAVVEHEGLPFAYKGDIENADQVAEEVAALASSILSSAKLRTAGVEEAREAVMAYNGRGLLLVRGTDYSLGVLGEKHVLEAAADPIDRFVSGKPVRCPKCGETLDDKVAECPNCGKKIPFTAPICPHCRTAIASRKCPKCGAEVEIAKVPVKEKVRVVERVVEKPVEKPAAPPTELAKVPVEEAAVEEARLGAAAVAIAIVLLIVYFILGYLMGIPLELLAILGIPLYAAVAIVIAAKA